MVDGVDETLQECIEFSKPRTGCYIIHRSNYSIKQLANNILPIYDETIYETPYKMSML